MTLHLVRSRPVDPGTPTRAGLWAAAVILEARAGTSPRVVISDAMARQVAAALRELAALKRRDRDG